MLMAFVCDEYDKIIYYISGKIKKEELISRNDDKSHTKNIKKFMCKKGKCKSVKKGSVKV